MGYFHIFVSDTNLSSLHSKTKNINKMIHLTLKHVSFSFSDLPVRLGLLFSPFLSLYAQIMNYNPKKVLAGWEDVGLGKKNGDAWFDCMAQ